MKITQNGSIINMNFETEGVADISVDVNSLPDAVKISALMFGFQTALRNSTAGKLDELEKAVASVQGRIKTWTDGSWLSQAESKAAVEITDDEKKSLIAATLVMARRAQGDTRTDEEILTAFNGLPAERQTAVLAALAKPIDKRIREALRQKKAMAKGVATGVQF
jgi:hypothetical protein